MPKSPSIQCNGKKDITDNWCLFDVNLDANSRNDILRMFDLRKQSKYQITVKFTNIWNKTVVESLNLFKINGKDTVESIKEKMALNFICDLEVEEIKVVCNTVTANLQLSNIGYINPI